ncbi:MAG: DUF4783 domain-containing protein [Chitinophagaceae bacterium]
MKRNVSMGRISRAFLLLMVLSSFSILSPFNDVVNSLESGNVSSLSKYFGSSVEITLMDKTNSYSKSQAEVILKEFFLQNKVKTFQVIHQGSSRDGSSYGIGNLYTNSGQIFRTSFFLRKKGDEVVLQELRFESN